MAPQFLQYTPKFLRTHKVTAGWEGTWSNHKADPGGKTMYGVTEARFHQWLDLTGQPRQPVRSITHAEALAIYFSGYWQLMACESLFPGVDLATYDAGVNSGPARARKWLLASLDPQNRHDRTVKAICARRLGFVETLKHWKEFGRGWSNRIADIQAKGVAWALVEMMGPGANAAAHLEDEASAKRSAAKKQNMAGGTTGAGSAGTAIAFDAAEPPPAPGALEVIASGPALADWLLVGGGLVLFAVAAYLFWRAFLNTTQANAYSKEAGRHHA